MSEQQSKLFLSARFTSVEEFSMAVKDWDIEFLQLDPGVLKADVLQLGLGSVQLGNYNFNRSFHQLGASPQGVRTFGLVNPPGTNWCGRMTDDDTILAFPMSGDYESFSEPGFRAWTISISEERLNTISNALGIPTVDEITGSGNIIIRCNRGSVEQVRQSIANVCRYVSKSPDLLNRTSLFKELNYELPTRLLLTLVQNREMLIESPNRRRKAINTSREFIIANYGDVTIQELCHVSGVSWRTLDYAFKETMGIGPKKYLEAFRLNKVHKELSLPFDGSKISDIANRWGYWHMGRFAHNYKNFFGEFPSETLSKSDQAFN
jgi:AraC family ethanolamine operon transcriptional activator